MPTIKRLPSQKYLQECFTYNPKTGVLRWRVRPRKHFRTYKGWMDSKAKWAGMIAGSANERYCQVCIDYRPYAYHRIIWKLVTGKEPFSVDHIDGNTMNNKWSNLRIATMSQQRRNSGPKLNGSSGRKGVTLHKGKWQSQITYNGSTHYLGRFDDLDDAAAAYSDAARKAYGKFYRETRK